MFQKYNGILIYGAMICDWHSLNTNSRPSKMVFGENSNHTTPTQSKRENTEYNPSNSHAPDSFDSNRQKINRQSTKEKR